MVWWTARCRPRHMAPLGRRTLATGVCCASPGAAGRPDRLAYGPGPGHRLPHLAAPGLGALADTVARAPPCATAGLTPAISSTSIPSGWGASGRAAAGASPAQPQPRHRLGPRARGRRRHHSPGLRRGAARRAPDKHGRPSLGAPWPSLRPTASRRRLLTDNGCCTTRHLCRRLCRPGPATLAHAALSAADQRQGGGLREDRAERLGLQRPYDSTSERIAALPRFLTYYNRYRHHGGLDGDTPFGRLTASITS